MIELLDPASASLMSLPGRPSSKAVRSLTSASIYPGVLGVTAPLPGRLDMAEPYPESVRVLYSM